FQPPPRAPSYIHLRLPLSFVPLPRTRSPLFPYTTLFRSEIRFYLVHHMFCFFYTPFWIKRDRNPSEHHGCEKHFKECRFIIDQNGYFLSLFSIFTYFQILLNVTNGVIQFDFFKYILSIENRFMMWLLLCNLSYVEANAHM